MAEQDIASEQLKRGQTVKLTHAQWGEVMLGSLMRERGASYELRNFYESFQYGGNPFEVYFRTETDNIYLLDRYGNLINSRETAKQKGKISGIKLNKEDLKKMKLVVGESFEFKGGNTSRVTEVVTLDNNLYTSHGMKGIKAKSSILEEFQQRVPPKAIGEREVDPLNPGIRLGFRSFPDDLPNSPKPQSRS